ncbi:MAG: hypothetical protein P5676_24940, partial [Limnospira sp. PMC 1252.20]|nr:hypothetical protein [Limnospira sp. PMC 1252.20]MDT9318730.1 hypothetical protein [Limnospira sp. PMC 1306.21]
MREVEERSRRTKDIVRNRNYRQAIDVIEREVKRLEADDKPRARVRFPRDDGDIDIDVGGIIEFAQAMKPKISAEAEDLQDGRTRRGIKAEKIGSTARGFVDLDEDGSPKGVGGTIDSINDANVSVYFGECEQTMSVTMFGKTVTFARNVCEDDRDEEGDDNRRGGEEEENAGVAGSIDTSIPGPPLGFTGYLCMPYLSYYQMFADPVITEPNRALLESLVGTTLKYLPYELEVSFSIYDNVRVEISRFNLRYTNIASITKWRASKQEEGGFNRDTTLIGLHTTVKKAGRATKWNGPRYYNKSLTVVGSSRPTMESVSATAIVPPKGIVNNTTLLDWYWIIQHSFHLNIYRRNHPDFPCRWVNNYQPEPTPSLPILRDDMNKECCEDSIKMTREIHKALGVRKLLD